MEIKYGNGAPLCCKLFWHFRNESGGPWLCLTILVGICKRGKWTPCQKEKLLLAMLCTVYVNKMKLARKSKVGCWSCCWIGFGIETAAPFCCFRGGVHGCSSSVFYSWQPDLFCYISPESCCFIVVVELVEELCSCWLERWSPDWYMDSKSASRMCSPDINNVSVAALLN